MIHKANAFKEEYCDKKKTPPPAPSPLKIPHRVGVGVRGRILS